MFLESWQKSCHIHAGEPFDQVWRSGCWVLRGLSAEHIFDHCGVHAELWIHITSLTRQPYRFQIVAVSTAIINTQVILKMEVTVFCIVIDQAAVPGVDLITTIYQNTRD